MPTIHQTLVRPGGIVTQPNAAGELPPGTLKTGNNIMLRKPSVIQPRPGFSPWPADPLPEAVINEPAKMWQLSDTQILVLDADDLDEPVYNSLDSTTQTVLAAAPGIQVAGAPGMAHLTLARSRGILSNVYDASATLPPVALGGTRFRSPLVVEPFPKDPSFGLRRAGLEPLAYVDAVGLSTGGPGDWFLTNNFVGYRAVHKRIFSDGYIQISAPTSPRVLVSGGDCIPVLTIYPQGDNLDPLLEGDLIEVYRTPQVSDFDLVGADFFLSITHTVTAAEEGTPSITFRDVILEDGLGADLYTNPTQDGPSKANRMPPPATDVREFKGATFYTSREVWATVTTAYPGTPAALGAAAGIGFRTFSGGTRSIGSPTVTFASTTGVDVGQIMLSGTGFPANSTVVSFTPTSITLSALATSSSGAASLVLADVVVVTVGGSDFSITFDFLSTFLERFNVTNSVSSLGVSVAATRNTNYVDSDPATLQFVSVLSDRAFSLRASNGQNWSPPLPLVADTPLEAGRDNRTNRVHFSKIDQPEAVPSDNTFLVGRGTILRLFATQDSLFAFCTDGIFRIDGDGDDWSVRPFDPDTVLLAPDAVDSMDNTIYALTTAGFVSFTDSGGVQKISSPLIGDDIRTLEKQFRNTGKLPYTWGLQIACDKYRNEVWLNFYVYTDILNFWQQTYIWSNETSTFVTQSHQQPLSIVYASFLQSIVTARQAEESDNGIEIYDTTGQFFMNPRAVFNEIFGEDLAGLKEWIDVTIFFEDLTEETVAFLPEFEGVQYASAYAIPATAGSFEHVVAPLLDATNLKHLRFGFTMSALENPQPNFKMLGFYVRYRLASETLRA